MIACPRSERKIQKLRLRDSACEISEVDQVGGLARGKCEPRSVPERKRNLFLNNKMNVAQTMSNHTSTLISERTNMTLHQT